MVTEPIEGQTSTGLGEGRSGVRVRTGCQGETLEDEMLSKELCWFGMRADRGKPHQLQSEPHRERMQQGWTTAHVLDWLHRE